MTRIQAGAATMAALINYISIDVDRVILDKTGFTAPFNFFLDFASAREAGLGPTIFTALEEQLGLRLRPASGPVDVLVIDRAERPSEN